MDGRLSSEQPIYTSRQSRIFLGDAALVMCGEAYCNRRIADINVGVVAHLLREIRDTIDKGNTIGKRRELVCLAEHPIYYRPTGHLAECSLDCIFAKPRHTSPHFTKGVCIPACTRISWCEHQSCYSPLTADDDLSRPL